MRIKKRIPFDGLNIIEAMVEQRQSRTVSYPAPKRSVNPAIFDGFSIPETASLNPKTKPEQKTRIDCLISRRKANVG